MTQRVPLCLCKSIMGVFNDFIGWLGKKMLRNAALGPFATIGLSLRDIDSVNKGNGSGSTAIDSWLNSQTQAGPTGRDLWLADREDSVNQRTVADLQAAGLNPALMYNGGASQVPVSSASSGNPAGLSDIIQLAMLPLQMQSAKADISLKESEADRNAADAANTRQSTDFAAQLQPLLVEARQVSNSLGRTERVKMEREIDLLAENMTKVAAETKTENERAALFAAETALRSAEMNQLVALMPYRQALLDAQTAEAKAHAALLAVQEMYQSKIVNSDYLDNMIEQMRSEAVSAQAKSALDDLKTRLRTGKLINVSDDASLLAKIGAGAVNYPVAVVANILDNAAPIVAAALGAGAAVKVAGLKSAGSQSSSSSILVPGSTSEFGSSYHYGSR